MRRARLTLALVAAASLASMPVGVLAHSGLVSSRPAAGEFSFRHGEDETVPDTALPPPRSPNVLVMAGSGLLALSCFTAAWTVLRRTRRR